MQLMSFLQEPTVSDPRWREFVARFLENFTRGQMIAGAVCLVVGVAFLRFMIWYFSEERWLVRAVRRQLYLMGRYSRDRSRRPPEGDEDEVMRDRFVGDEKMRL